MKNETRPIGATRATAEKGQPSLAGEGSLGAKTVLVRLNGKERQITSGLTVTGLLDALDLRPALVVVELNRVIVGREEYAKTPIKEGDTVELVHFVGGG